MTHMAPGSDGPNSRELRLVGAVRGKRVLDLGCATGQIAISVARAGAVVIAVDGSPVLLAHARAQAEAAEVRVEWHEGDLADLAFLRADSIDAAVSVGAVAETADLARLFRQVQRVLRPNAPFVFSYEHPFASCVGAGGSVGHSYFDEGPFSVERHGQRALRYVRTIADVFTELGRARFRVDVLVETPAESGPSAVPSEIIWRSRKEGS